MPDKSVRGLKPVSYKIEDSIYGTINVQKNKILRILYKEVFLPLLCSYEVRRSNWLRQAMFLFKILRGGAHTRQSHLIGTWIVGTFALEQIEVIVEKGKNLSLLEWLVKAGRAEKNPYKYVKAFMTALLLHDIGHPPFSHALEYDFRVDQKHEEITTSLIGSENVGPEDQQIDWRFALQYLLSIIGKDTSNIVYLILDKCGINKEVVLKILKGPKKSPTSLNVYEKTLHKLLESEVDIDRIDHVLRDAYFFGIKIAEYRIETLLQAIKIVTREEAKGIYDKIEEKQKEDKEKGEPFIFIDVSGLVFLEHLLVAREFLSRVAYWNEDNLKLIGIFHSIADIVRRLNEYSMLVVYLLSDEAFLHLIREEIFKVTNVEGYRAIIMEEKRLSDYERVYRARIIDTDDTPERLSTFYDFIFNYNEQAMSRAKQKKEHPYPGVIVFSNFKPGKKEKKWLSDLYLNLEIDGEYHSLDSFVEDSPLFWLLDINNQHRRNNLFIWVDGKKRSTFPLDKCKVILGDVAQEEKEKHRLSEASSKERIALVGSLYP